MYKLIKTLPCFALILLASCEQSADEPVRKLNDTGITWGADYPKEINDDCSAKVRSDLLLDGDEFSGDILPFQDCMQGADAGKQKPAFAYQKMSASGEFLDNKTEDWACVLDKVSGLVWEVKVGMDDTYGNRGLHDGDDLFTWYNARPKMNGGAVGDWNARFDQCTGYTQGQPMTFCNIEEFVSRVNKHGICGFQDWRVPSRAELESLVHFGRTMPAIDTDFFPYTKNNFYWSDTPVVGQPAMAWAVSFQFGFSAQMKRDNGRSVRLVRTWDAQAEAVK